MLLLAVETATERTSVALLRGAELVDEELGRGGRGHAERLMPAVDVLLRRQQVTVAELEGFAVSVGPGSFTGLRIGIATVKGLAFGSDRPVAAVPTLAALASVAPRGPVVALLDARREEVYAGLYPVPGALEARGDERVYRAEELARELPEGCQVVVGEGSRAVAEALVKDGLPGLVLHPAEAGAAAVGRLAAGLLARGEGLAAEALRPRYVRRAEAEVRRTGQRFEP